MAEYRLLKIEFQAFMMAWRALRDAEREEKFMPISKFTFEQDKRMVAANLMGIPTKEIAAEFDMPVKDVSKRLYYLKNKRGITAEDIKEPKRKVATINKEFDKTIDEMREEIKEKEPAPAATETSSDVKITTQSIPPSHEDVKHVFSPAAINAAYSAYMNKIREVQEICEEQEHLWDLIADMQCKINALNDEQLYRTAEAEQLWDDMKAMEG